VTVHELVTNAAKYGALSTPGGKVVMAWSQSPDQSIAIRWTEIGGPAVTAPSRNGFGSQMMTGLINEVGGTIAFNWRKDGLRCEITVTGQQG
jgi:two-component sensor histidine kinase